MPLISRPQYHNASIAFVCFVSTLSPPGEGGEGWDNKHLLALEPFKLLRVEWGKRGVWDLITPVTECCLSSRLRDCNASVGDYGFSLYPILHMA